MKKYTSATIIKRAEQLADLESSDFISMEEKESLLNESWQELYQKVIDNNDKYWLKKVYVSNDMELPADLYQISSIYIEQNREPVPRMNSNMVRGYTTENNFIYLSREYDNCSVVMEYFPVPKTLVMKEQEIPSPEYQNEEGGKIVAYNGNYYLVYARDILYLRNVNNQYEPEEAEITFSTSGYPDAGTSSVRWGLYDNQFIYYSNAKRSTGGTHWRNGNSYQFHAEKYWCTGDLVKSDSTALGEIHPWSKNGLMEFPVIYRNNVFWFGLDPNTHTVYNYVSQDNYYDGKELAPSLINLLDYDSIYETADVEFSGVVYITDDKQNVYHFGLSKYSVNGKIITDNITYLKPKFVENVNGVYALCDNRFLHINGDAVEVIEPETPAKYKGIVSKKYALRSKTLDETDVLESLLEDTELDYPNTLFYPALAYRLAIQFKIKQSADISQLSALYDKAMEQFMDSLSNDDNSFYTMRNVNKVNRYWR